MRRRKRKEGERKIMYQIMIEITAFAFKFTKPMEGDVSARSLVFGDHHRTFLEFEEERKRGKGKRKDRLKGGRGAITQDTKERKRKRKGGKRKKEREPGAV